MSHELGKKKLKNIEILSVYKKSRMQDMIKNDRRNNIMVGNDN